MCSINMCIVYTNAERLLPQLKRKIHAIFNCFLIIAIEVCRLTNNSGYEIDRL